MYTLNKLLWGLFSQYFNYTWSVSSLPFYLSTLIFVWLHCTSATCPCKYFSRPHFYTCIHISDAYLGMFPNGEMVSFAALPQRQELYIYILNYTIVTMYLALLHFILFMYSLGLCNHSTSSPPLPLHSSVSTLSFCFHNYNNKMQKQTNKKNNGREPMKGQHYPGSHTFMYVLSCSFKLSFYCKSYF